MSEAALRERWHTMRRASQISLWETVRDLSGQLIAKGAKGIIVFGSLARGTAGARSDVDLVAIFDELGNVPFLERPSWLGLWFGSVPVDILVYDSAEWDELLKTPTGSSLLREGVVVHGEFRRGGALV